MTKVGRAVAVAAVSALAVGACGAGGSGESSDGTVTLRFSWWGSDSRHKTTAEIIKAFEKENPKIKVKGEYGDWGGYWDKLATQVASNDAPDVIQMDEKYIREYSDRGALLDLKDVDTSKMDKSAVDTGRMKDGLVGISTGVNAIALMANPKIFKDAGVPLPDDKTWTWDDYAQVAKKIQAAGKGTYGATTPNEPASFQVWLRQQGKELTTPEGKLGFTAQDAQNYLQLNLSLLEQKALPAASVLQEDQSPGPDQSLTGTGKVAMGAWWTNQLGALSKASGQELVPLRFPSTSGEAGGAKLFYKSAMFMSASARTKHPAEAQKFIDFMVNSPEAGELNLADRGLPSNLDVRKAIEPKLKPADARSAKFIADIQSELGPTMPIPPLGFSAVQEVLYRYESEVFFKRLTPAEAAPKLVQEVQDAMKQ